MNIFKYIIFVFIILLFKFNLIISINHNSISINHLDNSNNNNNNYYLLFKPYNNDYNCLENSYGGLGYIILGNKTCISNSDISITIQLQSNLQSIILCKYSSDNCKNLIACEKLSLENQCLDPFTSSMFINSQPIPSSFTKIYLIDPINNSTYFNSSQSNYGYHFKQYYTASSSSALQCNLNQLEFTQFITNGFYLQNNKYPNLSQTFKCNNNIPELIIGQQQSQQSKFQFSTNQIIYLNQTCKNSNNYNNDYNYEITC